MNSETAISYSKIQTSPTSKDLQKFGWIVGSILSVGFGLFLPLLRGKWISPAPVSIGLVLLIFGFIKPEFLRHFYSIWIKLGNILGYINIRIILGIMFFLVLTPLGILLRIFGKDPLPKYFSKACKSYRIHRTADHLISNMERPF